MHIKIFLRSNIRKYSIVYSVCAHMRYGYSYLLAFRKTGKYVQFRKLFPHFWVPVSSFQDHTYWNNLSSFAYLLSCYPTGNNRFGGKTGSLVQQTCLVWDGRRESCWWPYPLGTEYSWRHWPFTVWTPQGRPAEVLHQEQSQGFFDQGWEISPEWCSPQADSLEVPEALQRPALTASMLSSRGAVGACLCTHSLIPMCSCVHCMLRVCARCTACFLCVYMCIAFLLCSQIHSGFLVCLQLQSVFLVCTHVHTMFLVCALVCRVLIVTVQLLNGLFNH